MRGHNWGLCRTCGKNHEPAKGFLNKKHTRKWVRLMSNKHRGSGNPNWKGGRMILKGYVHIKKPEHPHSTSQGYMLEHRLVMEKKVKRYLTKKEVVHHINGNTQDNRIKNLELFKGSGFHRIKRHIQRGKHGRFKKESP